MAVVLAMAAFGGSALAIATTTADAAQTAPLPLPTTPAGETSNPALENARAKYHRYLNEAIEAAMALERQQGTKPKSQCREAVKAEVLELIETLVLEVHPQIVALKAEFAEDGSVSGSLLKELGIELEAASTVLRSTQKQAAACTKSEPAPVSGASSSSPAGGPNPIVEILHTKYHEYFEDYANEFLWIHKVIVKLHNPAAIEVMNKLDHRIARALPVHANLEALEKELSEKGTLNGKLISETHEGVVAMGAGVNKTKAEFAAIYNPEGEEEE